MQWCLEYYNSYNQAPKNELNAIYENSSITLSDTDKEYIDGLLIKISNLSATEQSFNLDYQIDQALDFFKTRKLEKLSDSIKANIMNGNPDSAENSVIQYMKIEKEESAGLDLFRDEEEIMKMSTDKSQILFTPPGAVGELTGGFRRGDFVLFVSRAKGGKTLALQAMASYAALGAHLNVLHISLEMLKLEQKDRYFCDFAGRRMTTYKGSITTQWPRFSEDNDIFYTDIDIPLLTPEDIDAKAFDLKLASKGGRIIVESFPQNTFSPKDLENLLDKYETERDITFDVVVVDYADIMTSGNSRLDYRHQLDSVYKTLRSVAQNKKIAIFSASQSGRQSFTKGVSAENISEDIRKLATVTHAFAINSTPEEKAQKFWRLSTIVSRRQSFNEGDSVICLTCPEIARSIIDSRWAEEVNL